MSELGRATPSTRTTSTTAGTTRSRPCLKIAPGETVRVRDGRRVVRPADARPRRRPISRSSTSPASTRSPGPVYIDGAKPGDALKVTVLSLRPSGWGWTGNIPGFGLLTDQFPKAQAAPLELRPGPRRRRCTGPAGACRCGPSPAPSASRRPRRACTASFRRATSAATWTRATSPRAPSCTCRSRSTARSSRSATRMRRRATARSAAPRSKARSTWR